MHVMSIEGLACLGKGCGGGVWHSWAKWPSCPHSKHLFGFSFGFDCCCWTWAFFFSTCATYPMPLLSIFMTVFIRSSLWRCLPLANLLNPTLRCSLSILSFLFSSLRTSLFFSSLSLLFSSLSFSFSRINSSSWSRVSSTMVLWLYLFKIFHELFICILELDILIIVIALNHLLTFATRSLLNALIPIKSSHDVAISILTTWLVASCGSFGKNS